MESGPESSLQPLAPVEAASERAAPAAAAPQGRPQSFHLAAGDGAAERSPPSPRSSDLKAPGADAALPLEASPRGQRKVTASPEPAEAPGVGRAGGDWGARPDPPGTCKAADSEAPGSEETCSAYGGGTGSTSNNTSSSSSSSKCNVASEQPSPPEEESPSLDSLESFSNLPSFPSSCEFASEEGAEKRVPPEASPEGAASLLPGSVAPGEVATVDAASAAAPGSAACKERGPGQSVYHIKWIQWKEENTPIITQNENGPCPLLAILNVLLLAWKVKNKNKTKQQDGSFFFSASKPAFGGTLLS